MAFTGLVLTNACLRQLRKRPFLGYHRKAEQPINMRHDFLTVFLLCLSTSTTVSARLRVPSGFEDIRGMAQHAPLVFRGQVVDIKLADEADKRTQVKDGLAVIAVDRWYRGSSKSFVNLHFVYAPPVGDDGHYCRDLEIGSYWIVFAKPGHGKVLEMFHDCDGALSVSSLLGSKTPDGLLSQIEEDFAAGLNDSAADVDSQHPEARRAGPITLD